MFQIETRPSLAAPFRPASADRHVTAVCRSRHRPLRTVVLERFQTDDHGHQFHAVIRRQPEIGAELLAVRSAHQHDSESRTGIAERRAEHPPFGKTRAEKVPHAESGPETNCLRLVSRTVSAILEQVRRLRSGNGQTIATFVLGNVGMSLDPNETHAVTPIDA